MLFNDFSYKNYWKETFVLPPNTHIMHRTHQPTPEKRPLYKPPQIKGVKRFSLICVTYVTGLSVCRSKGLPSKSPQAYRNPERVQRLSLKPHSTRTIMTYTHTKTRRGTLIFRDTDCKRKIKRIWLHSRSFVSASAKRQVEVKRCWCFLGTHLPWRWCFNWAKQREARPSLSRVRSKTSLPTPVSYSNHDYIPICITNQSLSHDESIASPPPCCSVSGFVIFCANAKPPPVAVTFAPRLLPTRLCHHHHPNGNRAPKAGDA